MTNLVTRLREHAALHADLAQHSEESAQWARDLYAAADELSKPAYEREPPHCPTCSCGSSPEPKARSCKNCGQIIGVEFCSSECEYEHHAQQLNRTEEPHE